MAHNTSLEHRSGWRAPRGNIVGLAILLLAVLLVIAAAGLGPSSSPQSPPEVTADTPEDWHGNVRRSHWPR